MFILVFRKLFQDFLDTMHQTGADFTNSFRALSRFHSESDLEAVCDRLLEQCCSAREYKAAFAPQMDPAQLQMMLTLMQTNPSLLAMLGKRAGALEREITLLEKADELKDLTEEKKREQDRNSWTAWLKSYAERIKLESESSDFVRMRVEIMDSTNPRIVLRNFIAQNAIDYAERGDYSEVQRVLRAFQRPFDGSVTYADLTGVDEAVEGRGANLPAADEDATKAGPSSSRGIKGVRIEYDARPPETSSIRVSCSS